MQTQQGNDATRLGLERYVLELEMYGLTTVPPEATGGHGRVGRYP